MASHFLVTSRWRNSKLSVPRSSICILIEIMIKLDSPATFLKFKTETPLPESPCTFTVFFCVGKWQKPTSVEKHEIIGTIVNLEANLSYSPKNHITFNIIFESSHPNLPIMPRVNEEYPNNLFSPTKGMKKPFIDPKLFFSPVPGNYDRTSLAPSTLGGVQRICISDSSSEANLRGPAGRGASIRGHPSDMKACGVVANSRKKAHRRSSHILLHTKFMSTGELWEWDKCGRSPTSDVV